MKPAAESGAASEGNRGRLRMGAADLNLRRTRSSRLLPALTLAYCVRHCHLGWGRPISSSRTVEHRKAASRAGLNYVTDGVAGITRRRAGKGWTYFAPGGARIGDAAQRRRLNALVIPPAWTEVWICPDPIGHIQATARDARGRKQYRYHERYREARDQSKFRHMLELSEVLPAIRERAERDLRAPELSRRQILATVVQLLDKTLIRVGNDEYARENRSYGLTTLRMKHVQVNGSKLSFSFRGKSGVQHAISVTDRRIARVVQRCQDLPGQELFQYLNAAGRRETVTSDDVNAYLREISGRNITAKDFRTWGGTMLAGVQLRDMGVATTQYEVKRNVIRAIDVVAERLGNTRSVCRKYYVHPALVHAYSQGLVAGASIEAPPRKNQRQRPTPALRRDEIAVLQFLQEVL